MQVLPNLEDILLHPFPIPAIADGLIPMLLGRLSWRGAARSTRSIFLLLGIPRLPGLKPWILAHHVGIYKHEVDATRVGGPVARTLCSLEPRPHLSMRRGGLRNNVILVGDTHVAGG